MVYDKYGILEELSPEQLRRIQRYFEKNIQEEHERKKVIKATGGQARILKLQLRAFERIPSDIIVKYMTSEEREEYEILVDAYS